MESIVIYKSNTGYTKQYATLLSNELQCDAVPLNKMSSVNLSDYHTVIYGGGVRASKITGIKSILKRTPAVSGQRLLIFAVGANGVSDRNTEELRSKNIVENNADYPLFYMQGGFDPDKLNFALKVILQRVSKSLTKKAEKNPASLTDEDKDFLNFFTEKSDHVDAKNLHEIIQYINES